jgi:hypothetical protein
VTRNLSPFVVVLIDPQSRSRRLDRNPAISRKNLEWVLNGHPAAMHLFISEAESFSIPVLKIIYFSSV